MRALKAVLAVALVLGVARAATAETNVPKILNGLSVSAEKVGPPTRAGKQYLDHIDLFSLRRGDHQLESTLEIGQFRSGAPVHSLVFQRKIAGQIGLTVPVEQRLQGTTVFVTTAKRLNVAAWFRDRTIFILSIRDDYTSPKALIRAALEITP